MVLLYDDTFDGLLTAIFDAYHGEHSIRAKGRNDELTLFDCVEVVTDTAKADRVTAGMQKLDGELPGLVYNAFLSQLPNIEDVILEVLRLGFSTKKSPLPLRQIRCVWQLQDAARKVGGQAGKLIGILRLHHVHDNLWIADCEPDYHILPLIGQHFHERYCDSRLIIRDLRRRLAVVSSPDEWQIMPLPPGEIEPIPEDKEMTELWRGYFNILANPQRKNLKLQQHFVPLKFRKFMNEFE